MPWNQSTERLSLNLLTVSLLLILAIQGALPYIDNGKVEAQYDSKNCMSEEWSAQ